VASYTLEILVSGRDAGAGGVLDRIRGGLEGVGQVAGGILAAGAFKRIADGIGGLISGGIEAAGTMQNLAISLETLTAKELAQGPKDLTEALAEAGPKAQELLGQLRDLALVSPFEFDQVASAFRFNLAMGASIEAAPELTQAMIDAGAALGLTNEEMGRMTYNLAQAVIGGDLTAANLRQLKMIGFDLAEVFSNELGMSIEEVEEALKSGQLSMEQVSKSFVDYADKNFGGAAARLSKTWGGLKSSFKDLREFIGADVFGPGLDVVSEALAGVFDELRAGLEGGLFAEIGQKLGEFARQVVGLIDVFREGGFQGLADALGVSPEVQELIGNIIAMFGEVASTIQGVVKSALEWLKSDGLEGLGDALEFVNENWEAFKGAILGASAALTAAGIAGALLGIVSAINPVTLAIAGIGAAVGLLVTAWTNDWGGIRTFAVETWEGTLKPALEELSQWLSVHVVGAIEAMSTIWAETLQPAFAALAEWLGTNIPIAVQTLADFWTGKLWPALQDVWGFIDSSLLPVFETLGELLLVLGEKTLMILAAAWNNKIKPALQDVWGFISTNLKPIFEKLTAASGELGEKLGWLKTYILDPVKEAFGKIDEVLGSIVALIQKFIDKLKGIEVPAWLQGQSPPPMADWFGYIGGAASDAADAIQRFSSLRLPGFVQDLATLTGFNGGMMGQVLQPAFAGAPMGGWGAPTYAPPPAGGQATGGVFYQQQTFNVQDRLAAAMLAGSLRAGQQARLNTRI